MGANLFSSRNTVDVTLVTTAETICGTLSSVSTGRAVNVTIKAWGQLTTGATTTAVTPRIRRGTAITDPIVGEGNPITVGAAAGSTETFDIETIDVGADIANATYIFTLQQVGAGGNGTLLQSEIEASVPE